MLAASLFVITVCAAENPNVVMFFVDDLGYGDLGFTGHPTTKTPNFDKMAYNGKILTSWYSGCPVCSGSRTALMTGRQYVRVGMPGVIGPTVNVGLPLNETTVADQMKKAGYRTGMCGKWHLGQREMFLPGSRGFDRYLGIPYSDDMGEARATPCTGTGGEVGATAAGVDEELWASYREGGHLLPEDDVDKRADPAGNLLPLVHQDDGNTTVLEQPLDFTTLAAKYKDFVVQFVEEAAQSEEPFFLYLPFSHVHTTASNQPEKQYAGCDFQNTTQRGKFGDALHEADWIAGSVMATIEKMGLAKNTLVLFSSDNGPWMVQGKSAGSPGLHYGRSSGYWNVGKGSTWEGGVREPAFAYWPGRIQAGTRSAEVVSSLDLLPTLSKIAGVPLPTNRVYDGKDMSDVLFDKGPTKHDFLWLYQKAEPDGPSACRHGKYKAHWVTGPGLGGCTGCVTKKFDPPLLFNIEEDPSEAYPLTENGVQPDDPEIKAVLAALETAREQEKATMHYGTLVAPPDGPGEGTNKYGVCCDRAKGCDCNGNPSL